jgi:DNA-binding transcriptional LysR family regulator
MEPQERFAGLTEFVATAQTGSFTAAAASLGVTGSAVGKSVTRLEARLGAKLLHRTTRRLTLTAEGHQFLDACLRIVDDLTGAQIAITSGRAAPVGTLNVNLPAAFGRRHIMPVLLGLSAKYPHLDLSVMFTERTANVIDESEDLAVRIGALGNDSDLTAKRLGTQRLLICASPGYIEQHGAPTSAADLLERDCIIGWRRLPRPTWLLKAENGAFVQHEVNVRHEFSDGEALVQAAVAGDGLCQLPTWLIGDYLTTGSLVPVLEQFAGAEMPIHAIWPSSRYLQPRLRVVIDALSAAAQQPGSGFIP